MRTRINLCGVPVVLTRAVSGAKRDAAARELRKVALLCPEGAAREILRQVRREHREATASDRAFIRDVRDRGGVCFPGGMTTEEWRNRLPRPVHGKRGRCVPSDELAQELYDRGIIRDPSTDVALDHVAASYERARSEAAIPDERDLKREARRMVGERVTRAVRELVSTARRESAPACPMPPKEEIRR